MKVYRPAAAAVLAVPAAFISMLLWVLPALAEQPAAPHKTRSKMAFTLRSSAFQNGGEIPVKFTCDGDDASPPLEWSDPPAHTRSLALIADDPDAPSGTFTHWVLYDLPRQTRLPEGVPPKENISSGGLQGRNGFGKVGYGGPCPPRGKPHRYFFKLYALDSELKLPPGASKADVENAMKRHIVAHAEWMGKYQRQ